MTNETVVFNFKINPYFFEDINTDYGPVLKDLKGAGNSPTSEKYHAFFVGKLDYNDDSSGSTENSSAWADSIFNPTNNIMDANHCLKFDETEKYAKIGYEHGGVTYTEPEFYLNYNRIIGTKGFTVAVDESNTIYTTFGDDDYNLDAIFLYKYDTKYLIAYALASDVSTVTGRVSIPFITDDKYGKVLTTVGKTSD